MGSRSGGTQQVAGGADEHSGPLRTLEEAAAFLRVSVRTMRSIRQRGDIPVVQVTAGRIAFRVVDLDEYIKDRIEWPRSRHGRRSA